MVKLNKKIERDTKKQIFKKAKEASDNLVFWNHPNQKRKLNPLDQQELEYLLWRDNKLDELIYKRLGDDGWNRFKPSKLNDTDIDCMVSETKKLNLFLNSLGKIRQ